MNIKYQYGYVKSLLQRYGLRGLLLKMIERSKSPMLSYGKQYGRYLPTAEELAYQRKTPLSYAPKVSIVIPAYETPEAFLRELTESVLAQTYPNWELCIADGSASDHVKNILAEYMKKDSRIRYRHLEENGGISRNTNGGFAMAEGEYIALMDHDDLLTANALYEMVRCLNEQYTKQERTYALVYSDEDKIGGDGSVYSRPHFKPDYNPEFLRHNNYFCHFMMLSAALVEKTGGLNPEYDGAQDYDFVLRCIEEGAVVSHVPEILYHWRIHEGSTAGNSADKAYAFDKGCLAIEKHLQRIGEDGSAAVTANLGVYRVTYELNGYYEVTVVAEDPIQLENVKEHYGEQFLEEGQFRIRFHYICSADWQKTVQACKEGDYILLLLKGVQVEPEGLAETLLSYCAHPQVALAAPKLLDGHKRVHSCGYTYSSDGSLTALCGGLYAEYKGYFLHAVIPQNVSILPFFCVMFRREAIEQADGFDSGTSAAYLAADFCFRLQELNYQRIIVPEITAVISGADSRRQTSDDPGEREAFQRRWQHILASDDPCYNRNLSRKPGHTYAMEES